MNGAGNDFVLLDNRAGELSSTREQIARICDRHRGVGADGVLVLESRRTAPISGCAIITPMAAKPKCAATAHAVLRGSRIARPGRCEKLSFETPAGVIGAQLNGELVTLQMSEPKDLRLGLEVPLEGGKDPRQLCR